MASIITIILMVSLNTTMELLDTEMGLLDNESLV